MIFVESITFTKDFRCFTNGDVIDLNRDITLLVGDQGSGKSSILTAINESNKKGTVIPKMTVTGGVTLKLFDTEKDNPRNKRRIESAYDVAAMWHSHGQAIFPILKKAAKFKNQIILIDEPESGLSLRSQYILIDMLIESSKDNQFIIATHSEIFMRKIKKVYSCEHKQFMPATKFIKTQQEA